MKQPRYVLESTATVMHPHSLLPVTCHLILSLRFRKKTLHRTVQTPRGRPPPGIQPPREWPCVRICWCQSPAYLCPLAARPCHHMEEVEAEKVRLWAEQTCQALLECGGRLHLSGPGQLVTPPHSPAQRLSYLVCKLRTRCNSFNGDEEYMNSF